MRFASLVLAFPAAVFAAGDTPLSYNHDVRPILSENCFYCHGQDANKRKGDLRLDIREEALAAKAFVPGQPDKSELVTRIFTTDEDDHMPPLKSHRVLTAEQKELLKRWVAEGAVYEPHWAYVAPVRATLPEVKKADWARNAIDRFILARLEREGMQPSPEADRPTLIRR